MISLDIDLLEDLTAVVLSRVKALEGEYVDIGMFDEQGQHESGFSYVGLFRYLSEGNPNKNLPPRNTLWVATQLNPLSGCTPMKKSLKEYLSNLKGVSKDPDGVLSAAGEYYRQKTRDVFGDAALLQEKAASTKVTSESPSTPLIETGDLATKVAYRIKGGSVQEIGR